MFIRKITLRVQNSPFKCSDNLCGALNAAEISAAEASVNPRARQLEFVVHANCSTRTFESKALMIKVCADTMDLTDATGFGRAQSGGIEIHTNCVPASAGTMSLRVEFIKMKAHLCLIACERKFTMCAAYWPFTPPTAEKDWQSGRQVELKLCRQTDSGPILRRVMHRIPTTTPTESHSLGLL